jgi:uncharacterized protein (UPF0303 family)
VNVPDPAISVVERAESIEFPPMDNDEAVRLGEIAVAVIREAGLDLAVEIVLGGDVVFRAKLGKTGPENDYWLAAKAATARFFGTSSLLARLRLEASGTALADVAGEQAGSMALSGGSVPIRVDGRLVGTITLSGEPDVVDHDTTVAAIERFLRDAVSPR